MKDALRVLRERYGLDVTDARHVSVGVGGDTFIVTGRQGRYVLKRCMPVDGSNPETEPALCGYLLEKGIPVSQFIEGSDGCCCQKDGGFVYHVQRFVEGDTYDVHGAPDTLLADMADTLGAIEAALRPYPALPEGIGAGFFAHMTQENVQASSLRSLRIAEETGDERSADELRWRLAYYERHLLTAPDLSRLTVANTHGDFFISQLICRDGRIAAVIDWTNACRHPVVWEVVRSWLYADPQCAGGNFPAKRLIAYVRAYCERFPLMRYDVENMVDLYLYQIAVCDYYGQYFASRAANRSIFLNQARFATKCMRILETELDSLKRAIAASLL